MQINPYSPKQYYEEVLLKADIDPSDKRGLRRKNCTQHWEIISDMVDTSLTDMGSIFVGNWEVNGEFLYHRHLELGSYTTFNGHDIEGVHPINPGFSMPDNAWEAFIVVDTYEGQCALCAMVASDEVKFIHKFLQ